MDKYQIETTIHPGIKEHYAFDKNVSINVKKALKIIERDYDLNDGLFAEKVIDNRTILLVNIPGATFIDEQNSGTLAYASVGGGQDNYIRVVSLFDIIELSGDVSYRTVKFSNGEQDAHSIEEEVIESKLAIDGMKIEENDYNNFYKLLQELVGEQEELINELVERKLVLI